MDEGWAARQTGTRNMKLATTISPGSFVHFLQEMDKKKGEWPFHSAKFGAECSYLYPRDSTLRSE